MGFLNQSHRIQQYTRSGTITPTGRVPEALKFLLQVSAANTMVNTDSAQFRVAPGKVREVQWNYWGVECDVEGDCNQTLCSTGVVRQPKEFVQAITQCTATKAYSINLNDLRSLDNNNWNVETIARILVQTAMPEARNLLALDMLTYLSSKVGLHTDGSIDGGYKLPIINPLTGAINPVAMAAIAKEYDDIGLSGSVSPYLLGGGDTFMFKMFQPNAGMNQDGVNTGATYVENLWYDQKMLGKIKNDLPNGDWILAIDPRVIKYVWYSENAGIFGTDLSSITDINKLFSGAAGHDFILGNYVDEATGIVWDLNLNFDKCTLQWTFHLKHYWDIHLFPVECATQGFNGLTWWRTCPHVVPACATGGQVPSVPGSATTYTATPNLSEIPTISQSTIAGLSNIQEKPVAIANIAALVDYMNANYSSAMFQVSGSNITYTGYAPISASFNYGDYTITFAP